MNDRIISVEQAIEDIRQGKMVILVDDEDRENEGDLCCAAELVTPEIINFMATHARGLICLTLTEDKAESLRLEPMVRENESPHETAFTDSIDAAEGITTGISAQDRAHSILTTVANAARPEDLVRPGHVFPLRARRGGVLVRPGQTEGSVDLSRLAGLKPAGVICEIMNDDGTMARMPELIDFGDRFGINIVSTAALIQYRMAREALVYQTVKKQRLLREKDDLAVASYASKVTPDASYVALIKGDITPEDDVLVRIHKECFLGDFMGSRLCDCSRKLQASREIITKAGKGVLLYIRNRNGILDFEHNPDGCRSLPEDGGQVPTTRTQMLRQELFSCAICAKILLDLGVRRIRPITGNPDNDANFETYGLKLTEWVKI
jgi:3,4-dihydroxy 2-butanone 4-phosphate synthase / GTP cyclohydrolase II